MFYLKRCYIYIIASCIFTPQELQHIQWLFTPTPPGPPPPQFLKYLTFTSLLLLPVQTGTSFVKVFFNVGHPKEDIFLTPSMVYISAIKTHITNFISALQPVLIKVSCTIPMLCSYRCMSRYIHHVSELI